jgi:hypothetical protein
MPEIIFIIWVQKPIMIFQLTLERYPTLAALLTWSKGFLY